MPGAATYQFDGPQLKRELLIRGLSIAQFSDQIPIGRDTVYRAVRGGVVSFSAAQRIIQGLRRIQADPELAAIADDLLSVVGTASLPSLTPPDGVRPADAA